MQKLLAFAALLAVALAVPTYKVGVDTFADEESALFARFRTQYGKAYFDAKDESYRKGVFISNLRMINVHNEEEAEGKHTYTLAMNEFGDLTFEEFKEKYTGFDRVHQNELLRSKNIADLSHVHAPASMDWLAAGAVTPVKNQAQCGSCWAFSATGAIEGAWYIAKGKLLSLSEQELMDCSKGQGNMSCRGGLMDYAFSYVISNGGICAESDYPYTARDSNTCKSCSVVATISDFIDVGHTETDLLNAVAQQPVAVAIEADQSAFQFYSSGVMTGTCGTSLNHGVLAVGYGTLGGLDYWQVKNSWGNTWGADGYILIQRNKKQSGGQCGILLAASYPVI